MGRIPTHRAPTYIGEMLLEEILKPTGVTQRELAEAIHISYQHVNEIVIEHRNMTPRTALRLAKYFNMSSDIWMNIQFRWDLYFFITRRKEYAGDNPIITFFGIIK